MRVQMTWVEDDEFTGWDEDTQLEYLIDQRGDQEPYALGRELVDGETVDSEIEGWEILVPPRPIHHCSECGKLALVNADGTPSDTVAGQPMCAVCLNDYLAEVGAGYRVEALP